MKTVLVGVTGGVAAFKACNIVSLLVKAGYNVEVIMTENSMEFVSPLTFQSLSKNLVHTHMFEKTRSWDVEHIELAKKADVILIAPATANIIGKVANGIADDMLSTVIMATRAKVIFAPAMNTNMYENIIVKENIEYLKSKGYYFIEPDIGLLACNDTGKGKLPDPEVIVEKAIDVLEETSELRGRKILVTAGPTCQAIDPVRFITNHSTGSMGYAIAKEAVRRGGEVTLISGKTSLQKPTGLKEFVDIFSAEDMYKAVVDRVANMDIVIKSAAVADYTPSDYSELKLKKSDSDMTIPLKRTKDIAFEIGKNKRDDQFFVGFAAETDNVLENAKGKVQRKNFDLIVANDITLAGAGFGKGTNEVSIIDRAGEITSYKKMSKKDVAKVIMDEIIRKFK
ncbi:MAG: bifunctional phosphopantothenoylcysteine decarboxylase/phosphopantothenate--cysteine ligase CoaBC [Filifactoraceae bacterium]